MSKIGFDTEKYLKAQEAAIKERLSKFEDRLYLEIGGKLYGDFHATRGLPGYDPDTKLTLFKNLKKDLQVIFCVSAKQLASGKMRGDLGIGYDLATIAALEDLKEFGLPIAGVVINRFSGEKEAKVLKKRLERKGFKVYFRYEIEDYPKNLDLIKSEAGFGKDEYIETKKPLIIVWGVGPGSGKFSTCLSQIYRDQKKGLDSGYAKFETFPIWNLTLEHPVNLAYEAATADLGDFNLIDPYHLSAYKKSAVNYNRDIESFPILISLIQKTLNKRNFMANYHSPTDMGVNMMKKGIVNEEIVCRTAKKEIVFYFFRYCQEYFKGLVDKEVLDKMNLLFEKAGISENYLPVVPAARRAKREAEKDKRKGERGIYCGAAIELKDDKIVTGKNSPLLHAEAACILNAIKVLAKIPDSIDLLTPQVIESLNQVKGKILKEKSKSLEVNEIIVALAISAPVNPLIGKALVKLGDLKNCYMHTTHPLTEGDRAIFRKLGIWVSTDGEVAKKTPKNF